MLKDDRKESSNQPCQDRSLFIQDLILSTLAAGFELNVDGDLTVALSSIELSRDNLLTDRPPKNDLATTNDHNNGSRGNLFIYAVELFIS